MSRTYAARFAILLLAGVSGTFAAGTDQVRTANGVVEGMVSEQSGIRMFRGIPFAKPPVGNLRFDAPQPVDNWDGVRPAKTFASNCMQRPIYGNMGFRGAGMSEDCLYLNVWTPAKSENEKLPVLVYYFGGGYSAGDGSEPRYDGESLAKRGIVTVTVNYRLTVFGFLAHPDLTRTSPHHASGNEALLDQTAALKWVQTNIAAFGGDPKHVTIGGESAGSISVSALIASPLSKDFIAGGIMESGSMIGSLPAIPLAEAEQVGVKFVEQMGAKSLDELRAMPADKLLAATGAPGAPRFSPAIDGYFFPKPIAELLDSGQAAHVPLLGGSNSQEQAASSVLHTNPPTPEGYAKAIAELYPDPQQTAQILKLYSGKTEDEILDAATALSSDRFIAFSTWRFMEGMRKTSGKPVYRYYFKRIRPRFNSSNPNQVPGQAGGVVERTAGTPAPAPARGASHSSEIEYALGNLESNKRFNWSADDYKVSETMEAYFANFIKTFNPNGKGLPEWPAYTDKDHFQVMRIDVDSGKMTETTRDREQYLDTLIVGK